MSPRLLFLYEVTTSRHTRLRTIGERIGMTIQGTSEYAHGLEEDGLLSLASGEYRATKKGIEFLHDHMQELRSFVDRAGKEMAFVETTAAIAGGSIHRGARLGLFMEDGVLVRSEEHTSELQSPCNLVCRLLLEKKKRTICLERSSDKIPTYSAHNLRRCTPHPPLVTMSEYTTCSETSLTIPGW